MEKEVFSESITVLEKYWRETSHAIQSIRDNKKIADSELNLLDNKNYHGLNSNISFDENQIKNLSIKGTKPKVAILREQGVNGQNEMAAAFTIAGFEAFDVHMQDLLDGNIDLKQFQGMAVCGGFSYGDVLGAGGGWSKTILYNNNVKDQFQQFFENEATFTLGVCNGCQMLSNLKNIIPEADYWPSFERNFSDQFEARLVQVKVENTNSVLLRNMNGWTVPVASAHGEGRAKFDEKNIESLPPHDIVNLGISQVPEGRRIFSRLTVEENLRLGAYTNELGKHFETDIKEVYDLFPVLSDRKTQRGGTLSGGEQQMLAIGRALMSKPKVLLLDEPSLGIAPKLVNQIFASIKNINKEKNVTIFLVEQNAKKALELADRAYVLVNGKVTIMGSGQDLLKNKDIQAAYLEGGTKN